MAPPSPEDIERYLAPISVEKPAGASVRGDGTYDRIREARREDDPSIPQGVWQRPLKIADYNAVVTLSVDVLLHRSKDLQVASWLADAWAHLHGILGLTRGLELAAGLITKFWDGLFPELAEDDDDEARAGVLNWLIHALCARLRLAKLGDDRASFSLQEWERAESAVAGEKGKGPSREGLLARMSLVGAPRWVSIYAEVESALDAIRDVEQASSKLRTTVTIRPLREALQLVKAVVGDVLKAAGGHVERRDPANDPGNGERPDIGHGTGTHAVERTAAGPITSRAEAYERLTEAADYLLRTEPHSPVPYLVKRAISWGNLPLGELLQEFISGANDLVAVHRLLGMRSRND